MQRSHQLWTVALKEILPFRSLASNWKLVRSKKPFSMYVNGINQSTSCHGSRSSTSFFTHRHALKTKREWNRKWGEPFYPMMPGLSLGSALIIFVSILHEEFYPSGHRPAYDAHAGDSDSAGPITSSSALSSAHVKATAALSTVVQQCAPFLFFYQNNNTQSSVIYYLPNLTLTNLT